MEWTPRRIAAAFVLVTGVVNLAIVYAVARWLFGGSPVVLAVGAAVVLVGSVGGYRSLSGSLAERLDG